MIIRVQSCDGLERIVVPNGGAATVATLCSLIESQLGVPATAQTLSLDTNLLLYDPSTVAPAASLSNPSIPLSFLGLSDDSVVFLSYSNVARSFGPPPCPLSPASSFGYKMTMEDLIARQISVSHQKSPHCSTAYFFRDAADAFQLYVVETLAFAVKHGGFLYGHVDKGGAVAVDFIYEPPEQRTEEVLALLCNPDEEALVEAIAVGLGMRCVGFIFTQAIGRKGSTGEYMMSGREVLQAVELQAGGDPRVGDCACQARGGRG